VLVGLLTVRSMSTTTAAAPPTGPRTAQPARRRTPGLLRALTAVVAVHVVDDSYVQPPPGTSATDHLAGGLVLLVALVLAARLGARGRPGTAAVAAVAAGVLGLVVGAESAYYGTVRGPSGDDWTGLLALAAGAVLLGAGVWQGWRSRRSDGTRRRRYARRAVRGLATVLVLAAVAQPIAVSYLSTHVSRAEVPTAQLGTAHEDVLLRTSDGLRLAGWYVPSRNGAAVVVLPGRTGTQAHARMLVRHGYGVLLLDRRGEGDSEGAPHAYGWDGERDVHAAVTFLEQRPDVEPGRVGGLGLSVGGEVLLQAAAESPGLAAVVSEGAGVQSVLAARHAMAPRVYWPLLPMLLTEHAATMAFADSVAPPPIGDVVARIAPRPVLLVADPSSPNLERMNRDYRRIIGPSAALWELPASGHTRGLASRPDAYERRVVSFLDGALLGSPT
jgi:uncharacterized protein